MWYLPYERLTIETALSPEEVQKRLEEVIEPRNWVRRPFSRYGKPYHGEWYGKRFTISPIIVRRRNPYLPVIQGEIISQYPGTIIEFVMRQDTIYVIVMIFWCFFVLFGDLGLGPFWLLFPYLMTMIAFKIMTARSRKFFRELLEARPPADLDSWHSLRS